MSVIFLFERLQFSFDAYACAYAFLDLLKFRHLRCLYPSSAGAGDGNPYTSID